MRIGECVDLAADCLHPVGPDQWAPRHQVPCPQALRASASFRADLPSLLNSFDTVRYVLEMFRRTLPDGNSRHVLDRIGNRLIKMLAELHSLEPAG